MSIALNDIPLPVITLDNHQAITHINQHFEALTGYQINDVENKLLTQFIHLQPEQKTFNLEDVNNDHSSPVLFISSEAKKFVAVSIAANKTEFGYLLLLTPCLTCKQKDNQFNQKVEGQFRDILKEKEHYLSLYERMNDSGFWHIDLESKEFYWSLGLYAIHGVNKEHYQPNLKDYLNFYLPNEQEGIRQKIEAAIANKSGFVFKGNLIRPNKSVIKVESIGEVEVDETGRVTGLIGVFRNITRQEQNIEKLKLLAIVNYTINVPIFFIDEADNVVFQDLTPLCINVPSGLFSYLNFSIEEYLQYKKRAKTEGQVKENRISFDQYNSVYDFSVTYEPDEKIYIWIVENVTERFKKEQQQMISNRLTLLGNTFGNVSHDINNVLGVALGSVEMLELKVLQGETNIGTYIECVKNAIDKGKSVTERLLAFTRKQTVKIIQFDPNKDINDNKYLFQQLLLSTIKLKLNLFEQRCLIKFPQGEFINILLNIVLNAQDAIQEQGMSGEIVIESEVISGTHYVVRIKDSGIGIEDHLLKNIFDPFYSSKSVNKGNGIGLANVYNTVYKHNGEIRVKGKCDLGGAEFSIIFKCELIQSAPTVKSNSKELNLYDQNILVLDDEESIADFVAMYLEKSGANVNCVNSRHALKSFIDSAEKLDIFITDMILPDFTGNEAVEMVLQKFPDVTIYSISGYIGQKEQNWPYPVLRKPFNSKELIEFISKSGH